MIAEYLNQNLSWGHAGTPNEYNESTYTTTTIKGRKQTGFKLVRDSAGAQVVSSAMVMTETTISIGDLIDTDEVIAVNPAIDLDGATQWNEVWLI